MLLPSRPLRLRASFVLTNAGGAALLAVFAIAFAFGAPSLAWRTASTEQADAELLRSGARAARVEHEIVRVFWADRTDKRSATVDVRWDDAAGGVHHVEVHVNDETRRDVPLEVRYDANDPSHAVVSWKLHEYQHDSKVLFGLVLLAPLAAWGAWSLLRGYRRAKNCAREGEEIELHVSSLERHANKHAPHHRGLESRVYFFDLGGKKIRYAAGRATSRPLFLDENHTRALALRSGEEILIVRTDLGPFAFSPSEERAIRERLEKLRDAA